MPEAARTQRYFLSYSRSDEHFALRLAKALQSHGVAMWVDQLDIRPSEHWDRAIERAVRDCRGLVVVLSPRSVASDNVADEISYAIEHRKPVLPVLIEKCSVPLRITRMHVIDATEGFDRAVDQCIAELRRANAAKPHAVQPSARARLDPQAIATAKRQLISIIGPIAEIIVDKAASRASTLSDLHSLLMQHIDSPPDRARFASLTARSSALAPDREQVASATADVAVRPEDIETLARTLAVYLGPIAPVVAKRESRAAVSFEDLRGRLAALIPEPDRADFLKRLRSN